MTRVQTYYNELVADVTDNMGQYACTEEELDSLGRTIKLFKGMSVEIFE